MNFSMDGRSRQTSKLRSEKENNKSQKETEIKQKTKKKDRK
jgi:hypothetical protein